MVTKTVFILATASIVNLAVLLGPPAATQGGTGSVGHVLVGMPAAELDATESWDGMENLGPTYNVFGRSGHLLLEKRAFASYSAIQIAGGQVVVSKDLDEAVAYWPTATTFLERDLIAVAGKGQNTTQDNTIIELWKLTVPSVRAALDPQSGQSMLELFPLAVRGKVTVFDEVFEGRSVVRGMVRLRGKPYSMLVHFYDSGDLYELDYKDAVVPPPQGTEATFPLTKVFRATPGTDVPFVPALADREMLWMHGATHQTLGHIYFLWPSFEVQKALGATKPIALSMFDTDGDGALDTWNRNTAQQNQTTGVQNESLYTEKFLRTVW